MYKKYFKYLAGATIMVLVAAIIYQARIYLTNDHQIQLVSHTLKPKAFERTFKKLEFTENNLADSLNKYSIGPFVIKTSRNNIYILSIKDAMLNRFNRQGKLLHTIGNGKGRGPGEFLHPNDFYIQENNVWIADTRLLKISKFDIEGNYKTSFSVKYHPLRLNGFDDNLIVKTIASEYVIKRLTHEGKQIGEFGKFLRNQQQNPLTVGGYIETHDRYTIFAPNIASLIYYYRSDTLFQMARRPDGQGFKKSKDRSTENRKMFVAPEADVEVRTLSKTEDLLYVGQFIKASSEDEQKSSAHTIIDFYELSTGKYKYSVKPPLLTRKFRISGNLLIAADDTLDKIRTFEFDRNQL